MHYRIFIISFCFYISTKIKRETNKTFAVLIIYIKWGNYITLYCIFQNENVSTETVTEKQCGYINYVNNNMNHNNNGSNSSTTDSSNCSNINQNSNSVQIDTDCKNDFKTSSTEVEVNGKNINVTGSVNITSRNNDSNNNQNQNMQNCVKQFIQEMSTEL